MHDTATGSKSIGVISHNATGGSNGTGLNTTESTTSFGSNYTSLPTMPAGISTGGSFTSFTPITNIGSKVTAPLKASTEVTSNITTLTSIEQKHATHDNASSHGFDEIVYSSMLTKEQRDGVIDIVGVQFESLLSDDNDSTSEKPSDPIIQSVDINPTPTSYAGAAGASTIGQSKVNSNFRTLVAEPKFNGVNISIPRKVVEKVVEYFVRNNWAKHGLTRIMMNSNGLFFIKFKSQAALEVVLEGGGGLWLIHKSPIILKKWSMDTRLLKEELTRIPIWVKLHDVPIQVFEEDGINLIASFIGKPVMLDSYTSFMCSNLWGQGSFARCLIEVNSEADLVDVVTIGIPSLTGEDFTMETIRVDKLSLKLILTAATTTTTTRPNGKGVVVQEPSEFRVPQESQPLIFKDKGKGIMVEPEVPLWLWVLRNRKAKKRRHEKPKDERQTRVDEEKKTVKMIQGELLKHFEGMLLTLSVGKSKWKFQRYSSMIRMLARKDREDLEVLLRIVKAKHNDTRLEDDFERVLWGDLKVMFEKDTTSDVWRMLQGYRVTIWKLIDSSGVHFVSSAAGYKDTTFADLQLLEDLLLSKG
ncbi:zinc knuckle CX2CX4HX4C containing protein [Tanacetum coccineum]